ncbi:MAG: amino acid permease, partial [Halodesulfurarchaeum sp.]|nr:amino acid permease [Halodesulfurarchaeum sp.]
IGAGIFVLPAAAAESAGPAAAAAFVVGGIIAAFTALSISELGTAMPKAGGGYYYINDALGPLFGSIAGWGNWLGLAAAVAFYLIGLGSYATIFVSVPSVELGVLTLTPSQVVALLAGLFFLTVNYIGTKETGSIQIIIVLVLLGIIGVFTVVGTTRVDPSNLRPFAPAATGGWSAVFPATALVFVTYLGFAEINTAAEEIKNPGRNLPLAVIGSLVSVTILYALVMVVVMGVVPYTDVIDFGDVAVARVSELMLGPIGLAALTFAGLLATASSANASILASSRINFAMGRDGIITTKLNAVHPRFATPYRSIALTGGLIFIFIFIGDIKVLAKAGSVLHLIVYGLLNLALIVYRESDTKAYDPDFTTPGYPFVPLLGAVFSFGLIAFMATIEILLSLAFVVFGIIWYFGYARNTAKKKGVLSQHIEDRKAELPKTVVSTASALNPNESNRQVFVPLANPAKQEALLDLGCTIAKRREATLVAAHIVQIPDQVPMAAGEDAAEMIDQDSEELFARAREQAESYGVDIETTTVVSRGSFDKIFDLAREYDVDLAVIGWGAENRFSSGRSQRGLRQLWDELPCDVLVFRADTFDPAQILLPTAGGPDSEVGAEIAWYLREQHDAEIRLLHIPEDGTQEEGEQFLTSWAAEHGLAETEQLVESGNPEEIIKRESRQSTMTILGATGKGILSRALSGSIVWKIASDVDTSIVLVERPRDRSLVERLLGWGSNDSAKDDRGDTTGAPGDESPDDTD